MSAISTTMATQPDTHTPEEIASDKALVGRRLDHEASYCLGQLESYLDFHMVITLKKLEKWDVKLKPELLSPDSEHSQRVQQVLRQVQFV